MPEQDVARVARMWVEAFNAADWGRVKAGLTSDSVYDEFGTQRHVVGDQAILEVYQNWKTAMPDVKGQIKNVLTNGDSAVIELTWEGTHTGPLQTANGVIPASGKRQVTPGALALELGYRESTESWAAVLRSLRDRGLGAPLVAAGDGALGLWAALGEVFPSTAHQRCWNHRVLNLQAKLPQRLGAEARRRLREVAEADSRADCEHLRDTYIAELRAEGQASAATTLLRDWEDFVTFYAYPKEHWVHLRTSNPIESIFSGVRLRTDATKRMRQRGTALYLVFKVIQRLGQNWRALNGGENLMALVLEGCVFEDGIRQRKPVPELAASAA